MLPPYPPFSPLAGGEVIVVKPAVVVEVGLTLAGTVEAFDDTARANLKTALENTLNCIEPACIISLIVSSGSVSLTAGLS
jgi:hypothetical protein